MLSFTPVTFLLFSLPRSDSIGGASGSESRRGLRSGLQLERVLGLSSASRRVRFDASSRVIDAGLDTVAEQKKAD